MIYIRNLISRFNISVAKYSSRKSELYLPFQGNSINTFSVSPLQIVILSSVLIILAVGLTQVDAKPQNSNSFSTRQLLSLFIKNDYHDLLSVQSLFQSLIAQGGQGAFASASHGSQTGGQATTITGGPAGIQTFSQKLPASG